jgi:hypothetical protein
MLQVIPLLAMDAPAGRERIWSTLANGCPHRKGGERMDHA